MERILLIVALISLVISRNTIEENLRKLKRAKYYGNINFLYNEKYDEEKLEIIFRFSSFLNIVLSFFILKDLLGLWWFWTLLISLIFVFFGGIITIFFMNKRIRTTDQAFKITSFFFIISLILYTSSFFI